MQQATMRRTISPAWNQVILLAALAARMMLSVVVTVLAGRMLRPAEFGFFALVATTFGLAHELTDMGTGNIAVRIASAHRAHERTVLGALLGLRLVLSLLAASACAALALLQDTLPQQVALLAAAAVIAGSFVSAYAMAFQMRQAQLAPSLLSVAVQAGALLGVAALAAQGAPGWLYPSVLVLRELAVVLGVPLLAAPLLGYWARPRWGRATMRPFFGRAAIVAASTLFYHLQLQGGPFFVQWLRTPAELGAFAAGLRPLVPLLFIPWVIMLPLVPVLSYVAPRDPASFRRQAAGAIDLSVGLGAIASSACFQLAPAALRFLYGATFAEGPLSAVAVQRWLALPLGLSFVAAAMSTVLLADGREWLLLRISTLAVLAYATANLWLVPQRGVDGSAIATAGSIALVTLGGLAGLLRAGGYAPSGRTAAILLPALVLFVLLQRVDGPPLAQLALGAVLAGAAALAVWWFPGLPAYRAEQAAVSRTLLAGD